MRVRSPPPAPPRPSSARLVGQGIDRRRRRLEVSGLQARDDLSGELERLALLLRPEHGVHRGEMNAVHEKLHIDGLQVSAANVGVLRDADPYVHFASIRKRCGLLDGTSAKAHGVRLLALARI